MGRVFGIFLVALLMAAKTFAQASQYSHEKVLDTLVILYNSQKFKEIYPLLTPDFQKQVKEAELVDLFKNGLYAPYGPVEKWAFQKETDQYLVYILQFGKDKVQLNLALNGQKKISYLELLPYEELSLAKRSVYFSDNKKQSSLDSLIEKTVASYIQSPQNCGISIALSRNGEIYYYNYGEASRDSKKPCSSGTVYEIGSISKTFTGLLLAIAVKEGKVSLEDELRKFLPGKYPGLSLGATPVLLKHLANHSSGLPRIPENLKEQTNFDSLNPYKNYSREMLLSYLKTVNLELQPGKVCRYSNLGMALLGVVLEEVYGHSFEELVRTKILLPQGMENTFFHWVTEQTGNLSSGHNASGLPTPHWDLGVFAPAGGINSSALDMMKYLNYQLHDTDPAVRLAHTTTFNNKQKLSLAWFITKTKTGKSLIWHNGGTFGYRSFCGFIKENQCSVVVLSNSAMDVDYIGIAILDYLQR